MIHFLKRINHSCFFFFLFHFRCVCSSESIGSLLANSLAAPSSVVPTEVPTATETTTVAQATPPINIPGPAGLRTPEKSAACSSSLTEESSSPGSPLGESLDSSPGKLKKRNRCYSCRKKVGLTGKLIFYYFCLCIIFDVPKFPNSPSQTFLWIDYKGTVLYLSFFSNSRSFVIFVFVLFSLVRIWHNFFLHV